MADLEGHNYIGHNYIAEGGLWPVWNDGAALAVPKPHPGVTVGCPSVLAAR